MEIYADDDPQEFPLVNLSESSFMTLTHLCLNISINCDCLGLPILDPYLGFCEPALSMLISLESLSVSIAIQDVSSGASPSISLSRWRRLDETLAPVLPGSQDHHLSLYKLREVVNNVYVYGKVGYLDEEKRLNDAAEMVALIQTFIRPRAYSGLFSLAQEARLQFSFRAEVKVRAIILLLRIQTDVLDRSGTEVGGDLDAYCATLVTSFLWGWFENSKYSKLLNADVGSVVSTGVSSRVGATLAL